MSAFYTAEELKGIARRISRTISNDEIYHYLGNVDFDFDEDCAGANGLWDFASEKAADFFIDENLTFRTNADALEFLMFELFDILVERALDFIDEIDPIEKVRSLDDLENLSDEDLDRLSNEDLEYLSQLARVNDHWDEED